MDDVAARFREAPRVGAFADASVDGASLSCDAASLEALSGVAMATSALRNVCGCDTAPRVGLREALGR